MNMTCTLAILSSRGARGQEKLKIENTRKICNETSQKSDTHTHTRTPKSKSREGPIAIFSTEYQKNRNTQKTYMRFSPHLQISSHSRCSTTFNHDLTRFITKLPEGLETEVNEGWISWESAHRDPRIPLGLSSLLCIKYHLHAVVAKTNCSEIPVVIVATRDLVQVLDVAVSSRSDSTHIAVREVERRLEIGLDLCLFYLNLSKCRTTFYQI